jgi:broad specificity phosphatase PhoE
MRDPISIWWVRHAPTHAKTMIGWSDLAADLSDTAKLDRLATFLPDAPIVSSDLQRTCQTASAIACGRKQHEPIQALREIHFGQWEAQSFADVEADDPSLIRAFWETPGDVQAPGGESWNQMAHRVNTWVDEQNAHELIVVSHMGVILSQLHRALGGRVYDTLAHKIDNLSVTHLIRENGVWRAPLVNYVP